MADNVDERPIQTPRAWRDFTRTLGHYVPGRLGQAQRSGKRILAMSGKRPAKAKGK
jgi:hypothetical protein